MSNDKDRQPSILRTVREARGLSLRALARATGIDVATLSRVEAGAVDPRASTLRAIAEELGLKEAAELIGRLAPGRERTPGPGPGPGPGRPAGRRSRRRSRT